MMSQSLTLKNVVRRVEILAISDLKVETRVHLNEPGGGLGVPLHQVQALGVVLQLVLGALSME